MKETHIPVIKFRRDKYGDELMVDVVTLDTIRKSKGFQEVLRSVLPKRRGKNRRI